MWGYWRVTPKAAMLRKYHLVWLVRRQFALMAMRRCAMATLAMTYVHQESGSKNSLSRLNPGLTPDLQLRNSDQYFTASHPLRLSLLRAMESDRSLSLEYEFIETYTVEHNAPLSAGAYPLAQDHSHHEIEVRSLSRKINGAEYLM